MTLLVRGAHGNQWYFLKVTGLFIEHGTFSIALGDIGSSLVMHSTMQKRSLHCTFSEFGGE